MFQNILRYFVIQIQILNLLKYKYTNKWGGGKQRIRTLNRTKRNHD